MQTLMSVVRGFLTEKGYHIERNGHSVRVTIRGENGLWYHHVAVNEDDRWLVCQSRLPVDVPVGVPPEMRKRAALLITHLNYNLILGGFEMDMTDGEVAFKTSARFTDDELTPAMVEDLLYCNFSTFDRCLPGFMALIHGQRSIRACLKMAREPSKEPPEKEAAQQPQLPPGEDAEPEA